MKHIRCAIYTRKSTDAGLDSEFSSLDAQREACEAFIKSQKHEGWECLSTHYDDGGFTGGNTDRPALQRLVHDIEAGRIDCVVVYKVDRLSRSLLDFATLMSVFDSRDIFFCSITQQFNSAHSLGRLTLNILLSFAQFEREIIAERTRDKIAAARRKGKYVGGRPVLGYNVQDRKLIVDEIEAERVRKIFDIYLERESLLATAKEINRLGWKTKSWRTKKGVLHGGTAFNKTRLHALLTNVVFIGQVTYRDEVHNGEHEAIVDKTIFKKVQRLLKRNGNGRGPRNKYGALLRGLLRCKVCNCAMGHTYSSRGNVRYRYYVCQNAQKNGWKACPSPSVSAPDIEAVIVEEVRAIGKDPAVVAATFEHTQRLQTEAIERLKREQVSLRRRRVADERELVSLATAQMEEELRADRITEVQHRIDAAIKRAGQIERELASNPIEDETIVAKTLANFDEMWDALSPLERTKVVRMLVEGVEYEDGNIAISLREWEVVR